MQITKSLKLRFAPVLLAFALAFLAVCRPTAGHAAAEALSGAALKSFIGGKRIYLAVPLGGEIPLNYRRTARWMARARRRDLANT